ncbi:MAG: FHA domain-containing protein [Akkermansiaceae bacterium]|nr:FHA domain-containing protein [Akkermansiaceae bacterium]
MPKVTITLPGEAPQPYLLKSGRNDITTIGRGSGNDITIPCPSVSTRHCQIEQSKEGYILRDNGSTNGLKRDGYRMDIINLRDNMEVLIGDIPMVFTHTEEETEGKEPAPGKPSSDNVKNADTPDPQQTSTPRLQKKCFRAVLLLGLLAMAGVAVMPWLGQVGMANEAATTSIGKWIGFLGEFHPLFLHLPIGVVMLVLVMEAFRVLTFGKYQPRTTMGLFFGSATGIFAVVFGYCLYLTGDFSGELIEDHKRDGIIFTILLIATFLIKYAADIKFMSKLSKPCYVIGLIATTATMMSAGHHGGEITHGDPLDKAPWKQDDGTSQVVSADPVVYTDIIHPILEAKCISCHGPKKQKSGLRMDTYAGMVDGGEETDCLVPGDLEASAMISYLHLPLEDDLRMPPEGKKQLTKEEIQILEWWVKSGAPEHARRSELEVPPAIAAALNTLKSPEQIAREQAAKTEAAQKQKAAMEARRARLATALDSVNKTFPGALNYISQESTSLSFSAVSYRKQFNNDSLAALKDASADITDLDLSATTITDDAAAMLESFVSLKSLKLNQTAITDAALPGIRKLNQLKVLNLHSTAVTDEGIQLLHGMSSLKKVYLWDTKVTEAGAKALEKALTDAHAKAQDGLKDEVRDADAPKVVLGAAGEK